MATTVYITNKAKGRNIREENALEKQLRGKKTKQRETMTADERWMLKARGRKERTIRQAAKDSRRMH